MEKKSTNILRSQVERTMKKVLKLMDNNNGNIQGASRGQQKYEQQKKRKKEKRQAIVYRMKTPEYEEYLKRQGIKLSKTPKSS